MSLFSKKVVGLDIHDYSAELVVLKESGDSINFESYNRVLLPVDVVVNGDIKKPEKLKKYIHKLFIEANPKAVDAKKVALLFPPSKVLTHIFTFPAGLKPKEIKKSIEIEAETIIPYKLEDVYWDFMILNKESALQEGANQEVLFASINKDIADQYSELLRSMGLKPFLFGVSAESLKYALERQVNENETSLVIDIEPLAVNYLILRNNQIQYFFSTNEGGKKLFGKISDEFDIAEEILRDQKEKSRFKNIPKIDQLTEFTDKNYKKATLIIKELEEKKKKIKIDNVVLTGGFLNLPNFYDSAKVYFPNQNIFIGEPKKNLKIEEEKFTAINSKEGKATPYSINFSNAIGIALRGIKGEGVMGGINLIPSKLKESFMTKKNMFMMAIGSVVMAAISLTLASYMFFIHQTVTFERIGLENEKAGLERLMFGTRYQEIHDQILAFNQEIDVLSRIDSKLFSVPETFAAILDLIPKSVDMKSLEFLDSELEVSITGIAPTRNALLEMQDNFNGAEFIEEVIVPISNFDEKAQISFLIQLKLKFDKLPKHGSE